MQLFFLIGIPSVDFLAFVLVNKATKQRGLHESLLQSTIVWKYFFVSLCDSAKWKACLSVCLAVHLHTCASCEAQLWSAHSSPPFIGSGKGGKLSQGSSCFPLEDTCSSVPFASISQLVPWESGKPLSESRIYYRWTVCGYGLQAVSMNHAFSGT